MPVKVPLKVPLVPVPHRVSLLCLSGTNQLNGWNNVDGSLPSLPRIGRPQSDQSRNA